MKKFIVFVIIIIILTFIFYPSYRSVKVTNEFMEMDKNGTLIEEGK